MFGVQWTQRLGPTMVNTIAIDHSILLVSNIRQLDFEVMLPLSCVVMTSFSYVKQITLVLSGITDIALSMSFKAQARPSSVLFKRR